MSQTSPDLIVVNAAIRTMDIARPKAEALAVRNGRILALGSNEEIRGLKNGRTEVIDAGGRPVLPGFQDTHIHLQYSGTELSQGVVLYDAHTVADFQRLLAAYAAANPNQRWIRGWGWSSGLFHAHNLTREVLDAAVADRPVAVWAADGHHAMLNSAAIRETGLESLNDDPRNGHFVRDANGRVTGLAFEAATYWVRARMPQLDDAALGAGVRYGQAECNRHGITGVLDAKVEEPYMRVYRELADADELTVRVAATALVRPTDSVADAIERLTMLRRDYARPMASVHSAKFFLDGTLENRTGLLLEPYSDDGSNFHLMFEPDHLEHLFTAFDAARFQIHAHVIGDGAARAALDAIAAARRANGPWPALHQMAHIQLIDPADLPRFRELGVVANMQPLWAMRDPAVEAVLPMVGAERARWMYALRSMIDAGAPYTVSSDWGVSTLNPFAIMETAITRKPVGQPDVESFVPEQSITIEEAVRGYTTNAAAAAWRAQDTGTLSPGKHADLLVLDRDIFAVEACEIGDTRVLLTLLGGKPVHRSDDFDG